MLRIIEFREPLVIKLRLEGALTSEHVEEVRERFSAATHSYPGKPLLIDLGDVVKIDSPGQSLLSDLNVAGARLSAYGGELSSLVEHARIRPGGNEADGAERLNFLCRFLRWVLPSFLKPEACAGAS